MSFQDAFGGSAASPSLGNTVSAAGTATAPGAGSAIASISAANLPAGIYEVVTGHLMTGTAETAPVNIRILAGAAGVQDLPTGSLNVWIPGGAARVMLDGNSILKMIAIAGATAGAIYSVSIRATRIG